MSKTGAPSVPSRAFFGRRKGHKLRPHRAALFETLLPQLAVDLTRPASGDMQDLFPVPVSRLALEIGFGGGENLVREALAAPDTGFIGC